MGQSVLCPRTGRRPLGTPALPEGDELKHHRLALGLMCAGASYSAQRLMGPPAPHTPGLDSACCLGRCCGVPESSWWGEGQGVGTSLQSSARRWAAPGVDALQRPRGAAKCHFKGLWTRQPGAQEALKARLTHVG